MKIQFKSVVLERYIRIPGTTERSSAFGLDRADNDRSKMLSLTLEDGLLYVRNERGVIVTGLTIVEAELLEAPAVQAKK